MYSFCTIYKQQFVFKTIRAVNFVPAMSIQQREQNIKNKTTKNSYKIMGIFVPFTNNSLCLKQLE